MKLYVLEKYYETVTIRKSRQTSNGFSLRLGIFSTFALAQFHAEFDCSKSLSFEDSLSDSFCAESKREIVDLFNTKVETYLITIEQLDDGV